jgi:uncharacterized protein YrrD
MRISRLSNEIKGFQIISASNGQIIGKVEDVLIDPKKRQVAAIVAFKGNLLDSTVKAIPREDVQVWGEDVILTDKPNVICKLDKLTGIDEWESASDKINGKDVLETQGQKIGVLNDVVIDSNAQVIGYDLSEVFLEGAVADSKRIHVDTTEVFGPDALIVDKSKLYKWEF